MSADYDELLPRTLRRRFFELLESGNRTRPGARTIDNVLCLLIIVNVAAAVAETVAPLYERFGVYFDALDLLSVAVFTAEYLARLWVSAEHPPLAHRGPVLARLRFALSPFMVIDLLAILPWYLTVITGVDLRFLRVFRLVRLLKLIRYSNAMNALGRVLYAERRALGAAVVIMLGLLMFASGGIYLIERDAQPDAFGSIPEAMWWALATLTTVGYGDVVPHTGWGKVFGGLIAMLGIAMFALPVGIIAAAFRSEFERRDFVVTWGMVARVPIFSTLSPRAIAKLTGMLHSRTVPSGFEIARKGEPVDAVYFIVSGRVEVRLPNGGVELGEGDHFGEIALLLETTRVATVVARTECRFLLLPAGDFHHFLEEYPDVQQTLSQEAHRRLSEGGWHLDHGHPGEQRAQMP